MEASNLSAAGEWSGATEYFEARSGPPGFLVGDCKDFSLLYRLILGSRDAHSNGGDSTDDICVPRISDLTDLPARVRARNQHQAASIDLAPTAHITISEFDKINGSVEFILPVSRLNPFLAGINFNERIWRVEGIPQNQAEELLRGLAQRFGGDPAATDSTRVFRLPGFNNKKYEQDVPVQLAAGTLPEPVYHRSDFKIESVSHEPRSPDRTGVRAQRGVHAESSSTQSEYDWAYAIRHLRQGDAPEDIVREIATYRATDRHHAQDSKKPSAPKKPNPRYYAEHTVSKAMAHLGMTRRLLEEPSGGERSAEGEPNR
jgi:hypothetical protein